MFEREITADSHKLQFYQPLFIYKIEFFSFKLKTPL